jgi:hypothetical protein
MNIPQILDAAGLEISPVLELTTNEEHACAVKTETYEIGTLVVEGGKLDLAVLHPSDVLLQLTKSEDLQQVVVGLLLLNQDVLVPVHCLQNDLPPLLLLTHGLNAHNDQLRRVGKEQEGFWHLLRRLPTEYIHLAVFPFGKLPLSVLEETRKLGFFALLPQQQLHQLHLLEVPEVLVVKTRHRLVLVL